MSQIIFAKSQRGQDLAIFKDFAYNKHSESTGMTIWRCKDRNCHGRIHVSGVTVITETVHHHLPSKTSVLALQATSEIKQRAAETRATATNR